MFDLVGIARLNAPPPSRLLLLVDRLCHSERLDPKMNHYFGVKISPASGTKKGSTERALTEQIGLELRRLHDDALAQPVPGRFRELLRQLQGTSRALPAHVESHDGEA
jgi:hypothetical protein